MKKQIDFDASLIGQEGITVKYRDGETPDFVKVYKWGICAINKNGSKQEINKDGQFCKNFPSSIDLIMYREVKQMSVEEWKREQISIIISEHVNSFKEYRDGLVSGYNLCSHQLAAAIKNGEVVI